MKVGDFAKYLPTSTVGKVTEVRESGGRVWFRLDYTGLYYDQTFLVPADESEYSPISYKDRDKKFEGRMQAIEDAAKTARDVDISEFTPSGGG
ncbi:MAG: hypothetical protein PWR17_1009 [Candidatus Methanomethylophilaceae archaeon]|nr:hypothetical protein [Candidatus Methanomethylophilaceae archaeon]